MLERRAPGRGMGYRRAESFRPAAFGSVLRGAFAGLAGTAAMDVSQYLRHRACGGSDRLIAFEFRGVRGWETAPAPAQVARRIVEGFLRTRLPDDAANLANNVMHRGYGVSWGAGLGLPDGSGPPARLWWGPPFGTADFLAGYVVPPFTGLYRPIWVRHHNSRQGLGGPPPLRRGHRCRTACPSPRMRNARRVSDARGATEKRRHRHAVPVGLLHSREKGARTQGRIPAPGYGLQAGAELESTNEAGEHSARARRHDGPIQGLRCAGTRYPFGPVMRAAVGASARPGTWRPWVGLARALVTLLRDRAPMDRQGPASTERGTRGHIARPTSHGVPTGSTPDRRGASGRAAEACV